MDGFAELDFVVRLLEAFHIPSQTVTQPESSIPVSLDRGLRAALFGVEEYGAILSNSMSEAKDNTIYRFYDEYLCRYAFCRLPGCVPARYFFVGPYLTQAPTAQQLQRTADSLGLPPQAHRFLTLYYEDLPLIEDENGLLTILRTLGSTLWGGPEHFTLEYIDYMIPDRSRPISVTASAEQLMQSSRTLEALEENYRHERELMDAVSKGKLHLVTAAASSVFSKGTEPRLPDTLRNRKNYLIILNTLLRKAAEMGGVHPLHIDRLSSEFARWIEAVPSIRRSLSLQEKMIRDYCLLVRQHSLKPYSGYVGRAMTLVDYDLTADLSLRSISAQLRVNSNYLSTLFRRECGCTLTEYVNWRRIDRALALLRDSDQRIQEIAEACGFSDVNYFIRLFKRQTGITPGQYRAQQRRA